MNIDACYQLGYVIKKHGTKGEVSVYLDVDYPEEYTNLESVFVEINQKLVPFFIDTIQIRDNKAVIRFEDVDTQDQAAELKSKKLYLPLTTLPDLEEGQFYYHQIIDYSMIDENMGNIGHVVSVVVSDRQDLLVVSYKGKEVLVPINEEVVGKADHENREITVNLPEGLLDVYMD